jgi:hypothetical protein
MSSTGLSGLANMRARLAHGSCTVRVALVVRLKLVVILHGSVRDALVPEARSLTVFVARTATVMIMTGLSRRTASSGSNM